MRWKIKKTRKNQKKVWREWFAWYPVVVNGEKVWFETIMRIDKFYYGGNYTYNEWYYRYK